MMAERIGNVGIFNEFIIRSRNYKNLFDKETGFMRPKLSNGSFKKEFDPLDTHGQGFIEGNAWNYSLYVPHDPNGLIKLMGGKRKFSDYLDTLFSMHLPDKYFENTEDITREGIIGSYVHGNEPSHHVAYLYNHTDEQWKGQKHIRNILETKYKPHTDGLSGNDDCGQMSAWYIFSAMGFYPVAPGSNVYYLGSPLIVSATINLENGNKFRIETINQSVNNVYVKRVILNVTVLDFPYITHYDIMQGGHLVFEMSSKPN
jgi:predicted alpha-1,2-mannosidase